MRKLILLAILLLSACAPSETAIQTALAGTQASYTATPSPTAIPSPTETTTPTATAQPTSTPDPLEYLAPYVELVTQWGDDFERIRAANQRITDNTSDANNLILLSDLKRALETIQNTAKKLAALEPPTLDLKAYQDKAEELDRKTNSFANLYLLVFAGAPNSADLAISEMQDAVDIYIEIVDDLTTSGYFDP